MSKNKKSDGGKKQTGIAKVCILAIGVAIIAIGMYYEKNRTVLVSVGSSLIATVVSSAILDWAQEHDIEEVYKLAKDTYHELSGIAKGMNVNGRIKVGKHLKNTFPQMVEEEMKVGRKLEVDVIGMELFNFWTEQSENLLKIGNLHLRMIVQDPDSPFFQGMADNEQISARIARDNIADLYQKISKLNLGKSQKVELRLLYFPASATVTRVNKQLYIRTRLIDSSHFDDDNFFERYVEGETPYESFKNYFNNAWKKSRKWENHP